MLDGKSILAKVQSNTYPSSWQVVRAQSWRFIASGALLLFAYYAIINDASSKSSLIAKYIPFPTLTWDIPMGSGFLLTVIVLGTVLAILVWQYLRQRQRVIVFLPEGFVKGDLRTGGIIQQAAYDAISNIALREATDEEFDPVPHIRLELVDMQQRKLRWRIEDYYALSSAEIVRSVFTGLARAQTIPQPQSDDYTELSPQEAVALVRQGDAPDHWRIFEQKLPWRSFIGPLVILGVGVGFIWAFINAYFIAGPSLPQRFNSGRPFGDVLAAESVTLIGSIAILTMIGALEYFFWRKVRISHTTFIITQTKWIVAGKHSGRVMQVMPFAAVGAFKLSYWYRSYTLRYQSLEGKRHVIVMAANALPSPAHVCQTFLYRYARLRAKQNLL